MHRDLTTNERASLIAERRALRGEVTAMMVSIGKHQELIRAISDKLGDGGLDGEMAVVPPGQPPQPLYHAGQHAPKDLR